MKYKKALVYVSFHYHMNKYFGNLSYGMLTLEHKWESDFSNDTLDIKMFLPKDDNSDDFQISVAGPTYKLHKVSFGTVIKDHTEAIFKATTQLKHPIPTKDHLTNALFCTKDKGGHWCG